MLPKDRVILLADDSEDDRFLALEALKEAGIADRVVTVNDGEQVVRYLSGEGEFADRGRFPLPGLAILDIKMPRRTGLEALEWMRETKDWHGLPVIILSASGGDKDVDFAYRHGAAAYLVKPTSTHDLFEMMDAVAKFWVKHAEFPNDGRPRL